MPIVLIHAFCTAKSWAFSDFDIKLFDEGSKYMILVFIVFMENPMAATICFDKVVSD